MSLAEVVISAEPQRCCKRCVSIDPKRLDTMFVTKPATNSEVIFDELEHYFAQDGEVDQLTLARLERSAKQLATVDRSEGHMACSAVAALAWDTVGAERHVRQALVHDKSVATYMNAVVTLNFCNRPDLAEEFAIGAARLAPYDFEVVGAATSSLLSSGRVTEAAKIQTVFAASKQPVDFVVSAVEMADSMKAVDLSEDWLHGELTAACSVLTDARRRTRQFSIAHGADPDGTVAVIFELGFRGTLEDEFLLGDRLVERLSESAHWDPRRLCVQLQYVPADANLPC